MKSLSHHDAHLSCLAAMICLNIAHLYSIEDQILDELSELMLQKLINCNNDFIRCVNVALLALRFETTWKRLEVTVALWVKRIETELFEFHISCEFEQLSSLLCGKVLLRKVVKSNELGEIFQCCMETVKFDRTASRNEAMARVVRQTHLTVFLKVALSVPTLPKSEKKSLLLAVEHAQKRRNVEETERLPVFSSWLDFLHALLVKPTSVLEAVQELMAQEFSDHQEDNPYKILHLYCEACIAHERPELAISLVRGLKQRHNTRNLEAVDVILNLSYDGLRSASPTEEPLNTFVSVLKNLKKQEAQDLMFLFWKTNGQTLSENQVTLILCLVPGYLQRLELGEICCVGSHKLQISVSPGSENRDNRVYRQVLAKRSNWQL